MKSEATAFDVQSEQKKDAVAIDAYVKQLGMKKGMGWNSIGR